MVRRFNQIFIPALILLGLALSPTSYEGQAAEVGVRFPAGSQQASPPFAADVEIIIDIHDAAQKEPLYENTFPTFFR